MSTMIRQANTLPFNTRDLIGFDSLFDDLYRLSSRATDNFPRHNVIKHSDESYTLELAVAGYSSDEMNAEVRDGRLIVKGEKDVEVLNENDEYIHKGISTKNFHKEFRLSEHMVVRDAGYDNGILWFKLEIELPEEKKPRQINFTSK